MAWFRSASRVLLSHQWLLQRLGVLGLGLTLLVVGCDASSDATTSEANVVPDDEVHNRVKAAEERLSQSEGGRHVLDAIEAHGGLEAWYRAPTSSYTWEYASKRANRRLKSFLVVDNQSRRVYHDLLAMGSYEEPRPIDGRLALDGSRAWIAPDSLERPNPHLWALLGFYFQQIPFVLADPGVNYEVLPPDTLDSELYDMVRVTFDQGVGNSPDDSYTLYLDKETGRVHALRYISTFGRAPDADLSETFLDYQDFVTVDGLTVPTHFESYSYSDHEGPGDTVRYEAFADSISYRRPFDESKLEPPEDARFVAPPGEE